MFRYQIQFIFGAPVIMNMLLAHDSPVHFTHSCSFVTGGAAPPPALIERIKQVTGINVRSVGRLP